MRKTDQATRWEPRGAQDLALARRAAVHSLRRTHAFGGKVLARAGVLVFDANN
jgi:hypothetical protein